MIFHHHIHHGAVDSLSLRPVVIILSILMFHSYVCTGQDYNQERYQKCKNNFVCGRLVNVGYPFWGDHHSGDENSRPEYCGLPGYKLTCTDGDAAEIEISGDSYRVLDINTESLVMNITSKDIVDACPSKYPIRTFESADFKLVPDDYQLVTLYFDCSNINIPDEYKYNCPRSSSTPSGDAYFWFDTATSSLGFAPDFRSCSKTVKVPVMNASLGDLSKPGTLPAVIKQGFDVTCDSAASSIGICLACERSGGICGYDTTTENPICFCPEGSTACAGSTSAAAAPPAAKNRNNIIWKITVPVIVFLAAIIVGVLRYMFIRKRNTMVRKGRFEKFHGMLKTNATYNDTPDTHMFIDSKSEGQLLELQIFNLACLANATNNYCLKNKLGEGGFGPVYKGMLQNGQQIAVKRLAKSSGQGIEEFKNEVVLISKLQHRNLVKLFGCCIEGEDNMLIYEYMPNKSLDTFLFDPRKKTCLDWDKRFEIIGGIARGLLYLHRDSRLRVIHRDLKVSNILLNADMIPKISDFGMARIFGGDQVVDNTRRVVGTIGYMSPEYFIGGTFSEKSDVFSFGVLVLEVVSAKRNNSFYDHEQPLNLLLHAWRLWNEGKWSEIVDEDLADLYSPFEVMKCIHIGLLCCQNRAVDRPTMAEVDFMLNYETDRPSPKEPPYTFPTSSEKPSLPRIYCSNNNVTLTTIGGR